MDIIFFEKILIKFLFTNEKVRDKVIPFLVPEIFEDHKNIQIVKKVLEMNERFEKFPSVPEMRIDLDNEEVYNRLVEIMEMDISEYQTEFLLEEIEDFIREKLIHNVNVDIAINLSNNKTEEIKQCPDKLREAIAFSFDSKVGLDFIEEEERLYNYLHNRDRVVPTSIGFLNKAIEGGFHEKSLTLFMAETNLGKSLIMASAAVDAVLRNKNVLYVTCEMSEEKISERIMANMFDISTEDLKVLPKNKFHEKFEKIRKELKNKIVVKEYPPRAINVNHIKNLIKELKVRKKFVPDIIFIDYIGIMNPIYKNKGDNSYLEVKRISEEVRALAVELGIPIVSAVQTNRCLDLETSVIILENNVEKCIKIKDIQINNLIKYDNNKFNIVKEIYDIEENDCYEITLKSGKSIICSSKHLFPTKNKLKSIDNGLKIGDILISEK
jgi:replicative DNA helicase